MTKKILPISLIFFLAVLIGLRIGYINIGAEQADASIGNMNHWVSLDGNYMAIVDEKTNGYSVKINSAILYEYSDYLRKYRSELSDDSDLENIKPNKVLELDVVFKNNANEDGFITLSLWQIINGSLDYSTVISPELLVFSKPDLKEKSIESVKIKPDSQYEIKLPFLLDNFHEAIINNQTFYLLLTRWPTRNIVKIHL